MPCCAAYVCLLTQSGHSAATGTYVKFNITKRPEGDMRRRGTANGQPGKGRRRNTRRPKARKTPAAHLPIADLQEQLDRRIHERDEQLAATSEVLKVISSSPGKLEPVFDAMLANATRLCDARFGVLYLREGDAFRAVASSRDAPPAYVEARRREPVIHPGPGTSLSRAAATGQPVQIADIRAEPAYTNDPARFAILNLAGARTLLAVPMTKEDEVIGIFAIYRQEVRPFTDKQIELVQHFASQAVIAIENTRLLNELRQRTDDLSESLEQQTATSEVLQVISSSQGELQPVFEAMLGNATRICEAKLGTLFLTEGDGFRVAALHGAPPRWAQLRQRDTVIRPGPKNPLGRVAETKHFQHIADITKEAAYVDREPEFVPLAEVAGARTLLIVPMIKENELVGAIGIYRQEVRPFTDKQIELVKNFASQAVIAIENTRLLNELRESLQQQTATSEVLSVISRSQFDLEPILQSVVDTAARLCRAEQGGIFRLDQGIYRFAAGHSLDVEYFEFEKATPYLPGSGTVVGRAAMSRQVARIDDVLADPLYEQKNMVRNIRSAIGIPLMREGEPIGVIALARGRVEPFNDREVELLTTFAD